MKYGLVITMVLAIGASGCATKKFVRNNVDPLSQRVNTLESQNEQQASDIEELDTEVSRANERALTADQNASEAGAAAQAADTRAQQAYDSASNATSLARQGLSGLDAMGNRIDSLSDYTLVLQKSVLFNLESSQLTDDARSALDEAASAVVSDAPCVVEILGFTDTTGNAAYNLALSERRAKEVMRYLAAEHQIPLRQIQMLGLGSEDPAADNSTRAGREQNRRVEVKVYVAGEAAQAMVSGM